jgi:hypothetical protein
MRKMFRPKGPPPPIEEDVAALAGPGARRAGPRLIDRGAEVLATNTEPQHALRLLQVMAPIADLSSVPVVLQLLRREPQTPLRRDALLVLAWSGGYRDARRYALYGAAGADEKPALCLEMLRAQMPGHREIAVRCLLEAGRADDLRPHAAMDMEAPGGAALLRNEIRRAGWRVIDTETEFRIEPGAPAAARP